VFPSPERRREAEGFLRPIVKDRGRSGTVYLSRGSYKRSSCLDLSWTNKKLALEHFAGLLGVSPDKILRIGDQGQEGGNDFDLLDCDSGFSVESLNKNPITCHPVLAMNMRTQLKGWQATDRLLTLVLLFPPLSIVPKEPAPCFDALRHFERLALARSRRETDMVTQRLRVRFRYLVPQTESGTDYYRLTIGDIYDELSGGVKFRDWELDSLHEKHAALKLFDVHLLRYKQSGRERPRWCMYTDTAVLMRGPNYYTGLIGNRTKTALPGYLEQSIRFIRRSRRATRVLGLEPPDLTRFKFALAIMDNVRNILLQLAYVALVAESEKKKRTYDLTREVYAELLAQHTLEHFKFLLDPDSDWALSLLEYEKTLAKIENRLVRLGELLRAATRRLGARVELFKWRECDHFLQNITAVQLGLTELGQRPEIVKARKILAVGLAYGGIELPAVAQAIAVARRFDLHMALAKVSIYGNRKTGMQIRAGKHDYVTKMLAAKKPLCMMNPTSDISDQTVVVMDDNCTTCVTLQLARDFLVLQGGDVVGAVVVRFPGVNRHVQMEMPGHGFPDPEVLFSFIRGLIAPSPYTRLHFPAIQGNPYLDQSNMFDKAKERVMRYLKKNGTSPQETR
jgi:phosphoribosylpyrophosphate synthetase